jgi:hypothetical protein
MKKVIELLERAGVSITEAIAINPESDYLAEVDMLIKKAVSELQSPRWETPEQREKRTGEPWPDSWAVYLNAWFSDSGKSVYIGNIWQDTTLKEAKRVEKILKGSKTTSFLVAIICATEAGPPPDYWRPEEVDQ